MGMTTHDNPNGQTQREYLAQMVSALYTCEWHAAADLLKKQAKELEEWKSAFGRKFDAELTLIARVAELEKDAARLLYCYQQQMEQLVKPVMTFDEWCTAIDAAIAKEKP